jgi:hypothetical protein
MDNRTESIRTKNRLTALELFVGIVERVLPDIGGSFEADNAAHIIYHALESLEEQKIKGLQEELDEHAEWIKEYRKWKNKAMGWESEPE